MKKGILLIDCFLIIVFMFIILSKFINLSFVKIIQPIFFILIVIHIIQHWKIIIFSFKKLLKK